MRPCRARQRGAPQCLRQLRVGETLSRSLPYPRPIPRWFGLFLWLNAGMRWIGGLIEGEPFSVRFGEPEGFSPFTDDEEGARNEDWPIGLCHSHVDRRGD